LVLALLICSGLGACGATEGWGRIEIYRGAQLDYTRDLTREEDRKSVQGAVDKMLAVMDAERPRVFPLAAAELVLGVAMFVFAAAAMTGRAGARRVLVQVVIAQAVFVVLTFVLTPKLRWSEIEIMIATASAKQLDHGDKPEAVELTLPALRVFYRGVVIAGLAVRSAVAALVVVGLTRPRARAFYDAQSERPTEG
jgi:hypothetical protein